MPLGTRHYNQTLKVKAPTQTRVWDATEGRYIVTTTQATLWEGKGLWQASLRIEDPTPSEVTQERMAILRGRAYFPTAAALTTALNTPGAVIELEDGTVVTPVMKPKNMGGQGRRTKVDTGTFTE